MRLHTKFLLSMVLVTAGLTFMSLFVVRRTIEREVRTQIPEDLRNSVAAFNNVQRLREQMIGGWTRMVADLPILRALMTTGDPRTIQDASSDLWRLSSSDVLVLADRSGDVVALHLRGDGQPDRDSVQASFTRSLGEESSEHWWLISDRLYEITVQPIYFGAASDNRLLGFVAVGYEMSERFARQLSMAAASQVAFRYGSRVVTSTLAPGLAAQLAVQQPAAKPDAGMTELQLGREHFLAQAVDLAPASATPVRLEVLKSVDQATAVLGQLNRLLVALGTIAVVAGGLLVFFLARTFTKPLERLVLGVRALGTGDYTYPLSVHGRDEVAELTSSFQRMRSSLQETQQRLLESERLATIGQMASSISHDLRHHLAAVVANCEFLTDTARGAAERQVLYDEVRTAVNQMTDLIESLLEFTRTREALHRSEVRVRDLVERAMQTARAYPEFQAMPITVHEAGAPIVGSFDPLKLQRVFQNLLMNACEAVPRDRGRVDVYLNAEGGTLQVRVTDNGRGIPPELQPTIFEPFVSFGKENGTGLGLTVVQKIVQDHGGSIVVEESTSAGTVFAIRLPLGVADAAAVRPERAPVAG